MNKNYNFGNKNKTQLTEEVLHYTSTKETTPLNMLARSNGSLCGLCVSRACSGKLVVETTSDSRRAEGDPDYYNKKSKKGA